MQLSLFIALTACGSEKTVPCAAGTERGADGRCETVEDDPRPDDTGPHDTGPEDKDTGDTGSAIEPEPTPGWLSLADSSVIFTGGERGARTGRAVSGAGDIDGDGLADLLIGSDRAAGTAGAEWGGQASLFRSGDLPSSGEFNTGDAHTRWLGAETGDLLGHTLGPAGDLNADGVDDLVIAGYHAADDGILQGRVYAIDGANLSAGTGSINGANWTIGGSRDSEIMGHGLDTAGDADGDGHSDLVMGACCGAPAGRGRVWIVSGHLMSGTRLDLETHTPRWDGESDDDQAGFKVSHLGDVDGDGLHDVAVGARLNGQGAENGGKVYVLTGASMVGVELGSLADADAAIVGTSIGGELGYDLGPMGDLDDDGLDELLVGAHQSERSAVRAGEGLVFLGSQLGGTHNDTDAHIRIVTNQANHLLGVSIEGDMDLDGDGKPDLAVGASGLAPPTSETGPGPEGMNSPGNVYLFWSHQLTGGVLDASAASVHLAGEALDDHAGIRVTSPGDTDGDGKDDLLVATERGQSEVGRAYLLRGFVSR